MSPYIDFHGSLQGFRYLRPRYFTGKIALLRYKRNRLFSPPAGFCGVPGLRDSGFRFFPISLRLDGHHASSSAELPVIFRGDTINIHAWSRGSRDPRDLAVGFLATQLTGAQNNLFEYVACNIYIYICMYMCVCICIYANNLNDPRHYFVIRPSSSFCMDVCDHIINVFPAHLLNKLLLNSDFWPSRRNINAIRMRYQPCALLLYIHIVMP